MKKNKLKIPFKRICFYATILLTLTFIVIYTWRFLRTSDQFKITEVLTRDDTTIDFSYLKGRNLLSLDLRQESRNILQYFPECKRIRMVRILPNRIFINLIKRKPVALIKLYRVFALDEDQVLFEVPALVDSQEYGLPVILGMETKIFGPKIGQKYNIKELEFALSIIKEAKRNKVLRDYKIRKIDVPNTTNACVFVIPGTSDYEYIDSTLRYEGLEVKLSSDRVGYKVAVLANLMVAAKKEWNNIKYIDLRFKEPVIKLKDTR
ncbi:MAG: hypothetical protein ABIG31_04000 [Candidatus Omnitrophota bacterium]